MKIAGTILIAILVLLAAVVAGAQSTVDQDTPVYTVATLLLGTRSSSAGGPPVASDGSMTMFISSTSPFTVEQAAQMGEDLARLREKLKATFQLDSIQNVASMATWLSPGREMVMRSAAGEQTLVVTGAGRSQGTQPPFVAVLPKEGGEPPAYERGYVAGRMAGATSANFNVKLTDGVRTVFDRPMAVSLGQRSVFARHAGPDGALYFVVVAAPLSSADRATRGGWPVPEPDKRIRAPRLIAGDDPALPAGVQPGPDGTRVILTGAIGLDGRVSNIKVVQAAEGLTDLAVAALRTRRYEPARDDSGKPIEVQTAVVMPFRSLQGRHDDATVGRVASPAAAMWSTPVRLKALAVELLNSAPGVVPVPSTPADLVEVVLERWSSDAEVREIASALRRGEKAAVRLLESVKPRVGYVRYLRSDDAMPAEDQQFPLAYAVQQVTPDGGRRITIATSKQPYVNARESPIKVIEIRFGIDGKGEGRIAAARVVMTEDRPVLQLSDYTNARRCLKLVRRE